MIKVTFKQKSGETETVEVPSGNTVMEASKYYSKNNHVEGIDGDCGGACACGTCHVHVSPEWISKTGTADTNTPEIDLLEYEHNYNEKYSRLSCQIELDESLDGLVVNIP